MESVQTTEEVGSEAADAKGSKGQAGMAKKRQRKMPQKYKGDTWLTEFNLTCGDLDLADEDSFDDKTWSPERKKRKIYGGLSASDDEDEETPKKRRKLATVLPPGNNQLSPMIQSMLKQLAISKADITKKKQALNKLAASLVVHRWARRNEFPLLQEPLLSVHFREILLNYGRAGAGVVITTEVSLKKCWQLHYCTEDTKLHKECFLCDDETWGDFSKDGNIPLETVLDFDDVVEDLSIFSKDGNIPLETVSDFDGVVEDLSSEMRSERDANDNPEEESADERREDNDAPTARMSSPLSETLDGNN